MPTKKHGFGLGLAFFFASSVFAGSPSLTWVVQDQPPQFILSGAEKGQGSIDGVIDYLQTRLPGFDHHLSVGNIQRTMNLLQGDGHVAVGIVKTPEREPLVLFSEPFTLALPPGILVRRSDLPSLRAYLTPEGSLNLESYLKSGQFSLGVAAGRSYGPVIDTLLNQHRDRGVVYTRFADKGVMAGLLEMLLAERVNGVFVYRSEVRYVIRDETRLGGLIVLPLWPTGLPLTIHVAVPRSEWGRRFLEIINPLLVKARLDPEFRSMVDRWSDDETRTMVLKAMRALR